MNFPFSSLDNSIPTRMFGHCLKELSMHFTQVHPKADQEASKRHTPPGSVHAFRMQTLVHLPTRPKVPSTCSGPRAVGPEEPAHVNKLWQMLREVLCRPGQRPPGWRVNEGHVPSGAGSLPRGTGLISGKAGDSVWWSPGRRGDREDGKEKREGPLGTPVHPP